MTAPELAAPEITIVMPVYNVVAFLPRCLDSVAQQTYRNFRLLAVDDGSTDGSAELLDRFAAEHPYCTVLHQPNRGVSEARNRGVAAANSEYLAFLDSDDFLEPNFLQRLFETAVATDADITCCFHYYYFPEGDWNVLHPLRCRGVYSREAALTKLMQDLQIQSYLWNKLFRRKLFVEGGVTFPTMCFEDLATVHRLFARANRVAVIPDLLYHYTQRKTSALKTPNEKKINDFLRATAGVRIGLEETGQFANFRKPYRALCRKTNFYADYYLVKIHCSRRSFAGFGGKLKALHRQLSAYQTDGFSPGEWFGKPLSALPDTLALPEKAVTEKEKERVSV